jgi:hypothetical protein
MHVYVYIYIYMYIGSETARTLYIADASFSAMNDVINKTRRKRRGDNFVEQPIMSKFSVQTLKKQ